MAAIPNGGGDNEEKTSSHWLRLRGLPYSAKDSDIKEFFEGLNCDEVQIIINAEGRPSGEAFAGFATVADAESGIAFDKNKIGSRYIEGKLYIFLNSISF